MITITIMIITAFHSLSNRGRVIVMAGSSLQEYEVVPSSPEIIGTIKTLEKLEMITKLIKMNQMF